jgi:hypothetical protein
VSEPVDTLLRNASDGIGTDTVEEYRRHEGNKGAL